MDATKKTTAVFDDVKIDVKMKLSALWVAAMLCFIYGDFFGLFEPGRLAGMLAGKMGPLGPTTQGVLLGVSVFMAIPSVMVFLSLALKPKTNRWVNIIVGVVFSVVVPTTMVGAWTFYQFLGVVEVALTALVVWYAWNWPKHDAAM